MFLLIDFSKPFVIHGFLNEESFTLDNPEWKAAVK